MTHTTPEDLGGCIARCIVWGMTTTKHLVTFTDKDGRTGRMECTAARTFETEALIVRLGGKVVDVLAFQPRTYASMTAEVAN